MMSGSSPMQQSNTARPVHRAVYVHSLVKEFLLSNLLIDGKHLLAAEVRIVSEQADGTDAEGRENEERDGEVGHGMHARQ